MFLHILRNILAVIIGFFVFFIAEALASLLLGILASIPVLGAIFRFFVSYPSTFYNYACSTVAFFATLATIPTVNFIGAPNRSGIRIANIVLGILLCITIVLTYISSVSMDGFSWSVLWAFILKFVAAIIVMFCCRADEDFA